MKSSSDELSFTSSSSSGRQNNNHNTKKRLRSTLTTSSSSNSNRRSNRGIPSGSPLAMIVMDQNEFEVNVGHAMDVLRDDYPDLLTENPDFSIYDRDLELIDPTGVHLAGVKNYKAAFALLHAVVGIFYCPDRSMLKHRMCFDKARQNIRIHWNAEVIPKKIFGGQKSTLYVDGISVYEVSRISGNITQHRIERLIINDTPVLPEKGIFAALRRYAQKSDVDSIPVFNLNYGLLEPGAGTGGTGKSQDNQVSEFRTFLPFSSSYLFQSGDVKTTKMRFAASPDSPPGSSSTSNNNGSNTKDPFDDALKKRNETRKKFGLPPLTPEEFAELQDQVRQLDERQQQRAASAAAEMAAKKKKEEEGSFFKNLFGNLLEDTCDSNFDCERPQVCCDFGFKKMCCSSGMRVVDGPRSRQGQLAEIPVIASPGPNYPRDQFPRQRY